MGNNRKLHNTSHEFLFPLSIPEDWLTVCDRLWNDALTLLNWRQHYLRYQECLAIEMVNDWGFDLSHPVAIEKIRQGDAYYMHCWIGRDRRIDRSKSWDRDNLEFISQVRLVPTHWLTSPPIANTSHFTVKKLFTKKAGFNSGDLPSGLVASAIENLCKSWQLYIKGQRGKPRYRGQKNRTNSLQYDGFRNFCKLFPDGQIKLLGMPIVKVPGIELRLLPLVEKTRLYLLENPSDRVLARAEKTSLEEAAAFYSLPGAYCLLQRGGMTYLQLSGEFVGSVPAPSESVAEIQIGGNFLYSTEEIKIENPDLTRLEKRIINLQRVIARCQFNSANYRRLKNKISKLQHRKRQIVQKIQHYHAQWISDRYGEITISKLPSIAGPCPIPRPDGDGEYLPNGATVIAEKNKKAANSANAQFVSIVKAHAQKRDRVVAEITVDKKDVAEKNGNSPAPPRSDLKSPNLEYPEHGKAGSDDRQIRGKPAKATPGTPKSGRAAGKSEPRQYKRTGRNRRRERAIG